ncbi:MAG: IS1380 family transposase [Nitrospinota bacterium]
MRRILPNPEKVEIDFTDDAITSSAGSLFLSRMARHLDIPQLLCDGLRLKKRNRGASDQETLLSAIYTLAQGDGALRDVDRLGADDPRQKVLGLSSVPGSRRLGEYLYRFDSSAVEKLLNVARRISRKVAPHVIRHEVETKGYVGLFMDGSGIEVSGEYNEAAHTGYNGEKQYWLHGVFIGSLWVSQRLFPGGVDVTSGWKEQFNTDIAPLLCGVPVWARMDNAYYRGGVVEECRTRNWDYSISVTHGAYKKPLKEEVEHLCEDDWKKISWAEDAAIIYHQPHGWKDEQAYVVVRKYWDGDQRLLTPRYTFILVSRTDLPLEELVRRHRGKCGQENAFKGPLIDLDLHHPPCLKFDANRAFYTLGQIAQMLLVAVQYMLLPKSARKHGIRTIIRDLVRTAGRLVHRGRKWIMKFAKSALRLDWIAHAADRLDSGLSPPLKA